MSSRTLKSLMQEAKEADAEVSNLESSNAFLRKEIHELREHAKEKADAALKAENAQLREELKLVFGRFYSPRELMAYQSFTKQHAKCRKTRVQSQLIPYVKQSNCGVGITSTVVCPICGKSKDITDISVW